MKVLSLYDGMACGMIAMLNAGVKVDRYVAYEIDKYAIKTATHNFPRIEECGDVFQGDFKQYEGFDFLVGGSPCTYWSISQTKHRETVASGMGWELFQQYVRALHEAKPKYFIYENNKSMSKAIRASIDEAFGFEAVLINSALVSAQNRNRLYWVGKRNADGTYSKVNVEQPEDRGILLKDVLDSAVGMADKSYVLMDSYHKVCGSENNIAYNLERHQRTMVAEPIVDKAYTLDASYWKTTGQYNPKNQCSRRLMVAEKVKELSEPINVTADGKSQTLKAQYSKKNEVNFVCYTSTYGASGVAEPITDIFQVGAMPKPNGELSTSAGFRVYSTEAKGRYLSANGGGLGGKTGLYACPVRIYAEPTEWDIDGYPIKARSVADGKVYPVYWVSDGKITIKGKQYPVKLRDGFYILRKLTVTECKRLQTVPDWYEFPVSDSQAYKQLGNGWTCDVITHLIESALHEKKVEKWGQLSWEDLCMN